MGSKGPLQVEDPKTVDIFDGDVHLVNLGQYFRYHSNETQENNFLNQLYSNYRTAMSSHHDDSVRSQHHMNNVFLNRRMTFTDGKSAAMLSDKFQSGYHIVTHFAPLSNLAGYRLLKELFKYDNIILLVTDHMWPQLAKMGLDFPEIMVPMPFAGGTVNKMIFTTDKQLLQNELAKSFIRKFINGEDVMQPGGLQIPGMYKQIHNNNLVSEEKIRKIVNETLKKLTKKGTY